MAQWTPFEDGLAAYERGNYATALRLFRPLAEQGNAAYQFALGGMYYEGQGVPQDYAEAVKWFRLAAEQGEAAAQGILGVMHKHGQGVPQDHMLAHMWLNLAVSRFSASDKEKRDAAIDMRNIEASKMTPEQIAEAQRLAREWKPK